MSALDEADFGSDTDDDDYVPEGAGEGHDASEEEHSGEEENTEDAVKTVKGKKKKKTTKKLVNGRKNMFSDDSEKVDWEKELEEERKELNEEKKKQKAEDLFAAFKKDTSSSVKATPSNKNSSISSLFDSSTKKQTEEPSKNETKNSSSRLASLFDDPPKNSQNSGEQSAINSTVGVTKPKSLLSGLFDEDSISASPATENKSVEAKKQDDVTKSDKIEIKKVFDFAGEMVTVSKEVAADSTEAKKYLKSQEENTKSAPVPTAAATKRPGGLAGIVGSIGKKQKMGVLDKSKLDWNSFVTEEGISEELKTHNKGKDG